LKKILFLDDDKALCTLLSMLLTELGVSDCAFIHSYEELMKFESELDRFDMIFLDVNLGPNVPSGIDAFNWLMEHHFVNQIVFFTGHANTFPVVRKALDFEKVSVLEKPVPVEKLQQLILG
jgi:DNA-binding NtrC family response regulator